MENKLIYQYDSYLSNVGQCAESRFLSFLLATILKKKDDGTKLLIIIRLPKSFF